MSISFQPSASSSSSPFPQRLVSQSFAEKSARLSELVARSLLYEMPYSLNILSRLPNVLFDLVTKNLSVREIAHLSQTNSIACHRVSEIRARLTDLNLYSLRIGNTGFGFKLRQHPNFTGIDLRGCSKITDTGIRYLAEAMLGKKMKKVLIYTPSSDNAVPQETWDMLIDNLDFSELEELDLSETNFRMYENSVYGWIKKLRAGSKLKICQLPYAYKLTDSAIERLVKAFPIRQMKKIDLRNFWLGKDIMDYIGLELSKNNNLEILKIKTRIDFFYLRKFIRSINSSFLRILEIDADNSLKFSVNSTTLAADKIPVDTIKDALLKKQASWPKIQKINIDNILVGKTVKIVDERLKRTYP